MHLEVVKNNDQCYSITRRLQETSKGKAALLDQKMISYGRMGSKVLSELAQRKDIPDELSVYASLSAPSSKEAVLRNLTRQDFLKPTNVAEKTGATKSRIDSEVRSVMAPLKDSFLGKPGYEYMSGAMIEQVNAETRSNLMSGMSLDFAAKKAKEKIFDQNFYIASGGNSSIVAPRQGTNGSRINEKRLNSFLEVSVSPESLKNMNLSFSQEFKDNDQFVNKIKDSLQWIQNPSNSDELMLIYEGSEGKLQINQKDSSGNIKPVTESLTAIYSFESKFEKQINKDRAPFYIRYPNDLNEAGQKIGAEIKSQNLSEKIKNEFRGGTK